MKSNQVPELVGAEKSNRKKHTLTHPLHISANSYISYMLRKSPIKVRVELWVMLIIGFAIKEEGME